MAAENKSTFKARLASLFTRTSPYDANPLIQSTEFNEVSDIGTDSQIFEVPTLGSLNNPSGSFTLDFSSVDEWNIDTNSSIPSSFAITLSNLNGNKIGRINISKKSSQTFSFNANILPFINGSEQIGRTSMSFLITISGGVYAAHKLFNSKADTVDIVDSAVTTAKIADSNITTSKIADSNITTSKLENGAVTDVKIFNGSVTTVKLANEAVTFGKLADNAVSIGKTTGIAIGTETSNADDKIASGIYGRTGTSGTGFPPVAVSGMLLVSGSSVITQVFVGITGVMYVRNSSNGGSSWSSWLQMI